MFNIRNLISIDNLLFKTYSRVSFFILSEKYLFLLSFQKSILFEKEVLGSFHDFSFKIKDVAALVRVTVRHLDGN